MDSKKNFAASRYLSRLDLNVKAMWDTPHTYWCRLAYICMGKQNTKPQRHSFFELHLCVNGSCDYLIDGNRITLKKDSYILIPPQKQHTILEATDDFGKFIWGFAPNDDRETESLANACQSVTAVCGVPDEWYRSIERILTEGSMSGDCSVSVIRGELCYLYVGLCRHFRALLPSETHTVQKVGARAAAVREFIKDNIAAQLAIGDIAEQFYVSERQLERICHTEYGMTVGELIRAIRVEAIRELLGETTLPISEIAQRTGFSDRYSMSKFFKKEEGMPPARYRISLLE